jgi:DNA mismatch endonuclease (patch repair protein)
MPKSNVEFWADKFRRNVERDCRVIQELEGLGWKTAVIWECDLGAGMNLLADELSEIKSTLLSTLKASSLT